MNPHLNIYRFFNESESPVFIENNLSRAFALLLKNNPLFFNAYIQAIVSKDDYDYLFSVYSEDTKCLINLQVNVDSIKNESFRSLYAIAMTSSESIEMDDFLKQVYNAKKTSNITDVFITIKDIAIMIEVKRTEEDCKGQLYNQVYPFINSKECEKVLPSCFSWQQVIQLIEKTNNIQKLSSKECVFINDFLRLSETRYPNWFGAKPFYSLAFSASKESPEYAHLIKRLRQALSKCKYELIPYDRLGLLVPFGWASELIPDFEMYDNEIGKYISFFIWPGNTKTQGYSIYSKPLSWLKKSKIKVETSEYQMEVTYNIKFSHFNKFISEISFTRKDFDFEIHTSNNFHEMSGKWNISEWDKFEKFLDEHFRSDFDWKEHCKWNQNFKNTDRSYFTVSFGFMIAVYVPYKEFCDLDKKDSDYYKVSEKINTIADAIQNII